ncbi:methionine aminopeptidase, type I [Desulfosporosinus orientis DSM 765]|uniref:Methionine aminopeptidase n=1 Tax=Desulfosporosinus orientis (strain ATCC 19365 / DSM 765 / NCIMB 8382 / VKM B-1628 / Singapore I) TaxID=768706 RepID=G7WIP8_DESOD|nr:type I methionyl aminopeptidase [Desulfosporosinus orientis]AET69122.1 methionine aminopeptidase, type I [Desulfosporosinus orientis DSM 765]
MVIIKTEKEIELMADAAKVLTACHRELRSLIRPGITSWEIDNFAEKFIRSHGATPEQKGYKGYPYATCASVNDEICHGFPTKEPLKEGDIVGIDMVVNLGGWLADSAWTYPVGKLSQDAERLLKVTKECLYLGIEAAVIGNRIGDVSHAIQSHAEAEGYSVVRDFMGHGIGKIMHEDLQVPHFGRPHRGERLREGMVFTIEPMINIGSYRLKIDSNHWTARTIDGSLSAQYEHTIAIGKDGPLVLTEQD